MIYILFHKKKLLWLEINHEIVKHLILNNTKKNRGSISNVPKPMVCLFIEDLVFSIYNVRLHDIFLSLLCIIFSDQKVK